MSKIGNIAQELARIIQGLGGSAPKSKKTSTQLAALLTTLGADTTGERTSAALLHRLADHAENGGLVIPSGMKTITENGTYDVTEYASVEVNVPVQDDLPETASITIVNDTGGVISFLYIPSETVYGMKHFFATGGANTIINNGESKVYYFSKTVNNGETVNNKVTMIATLYRTGTTNKIVASTNSTSGSVFTTYGDVTYSHLLYCKALTPGSTVTLTLAEATQ